MEPGAKFLAEVPDRSAALLLKGPPGIGKTHLWSQIVDAATERGWRVLSTRPAQAETWLVGCGLIDLLAPMGSEVLGSLPEPQRRALEAALLWSGPDDASPDAHAVAVAVTSVLRRLAEERPVLIAIDDLQWLDAWTGAALAFAARRLPDAGVGFLMAMRTPGETPPPADELNALDLLTVAQIRPLDSASIAQLVKQRTEVHVPPAVLARAVDTSAGNPFFAVELAKMWVTAVDDFVDSLPVPSSLQALVGARLASLPEASRAALAAAAALARPTTAMLRALGVEAGLAPAERAGVLAVSAGVVSFTHPLLAAATYDAMTGTERTALHRRLAEVVDDIEQRARHLALGADGPDDEVARLLDTACLRANGRGDTGAAIDAARLALRASVPGDEDLPQRRLTLCRLLFKVGDSRVRDELEELAGSGAPDMIRSQAQIMLCELAHTTISHEAAQGYGLAALETAGRAGDNRLLAEAHIYLAQAFEFDVPIAREHAVRARELLESEAAPDPSGLAKALALVAGIDFTAGEGLDHEAMSRAMTLEADAGVPAEDRMIGYYTALSAYADEFGRARELIAEWIRLCNDHGYERDQGFILMWQANVALPTGELDAADGFVRDHLALAERTGQRHNARWARYNEARLALFRGDFGTAAETGLGLIQDGQDQGGAAVEALGRRIGGEAALYSGDLKAAVAHLRRVEQLRSPSRSDPSALTHLPRLIEASLGLGERADALAHLAVYESRAGALRRQSALALAARCRALVCAADGDEAGARAAFEQSLAHHVADSDYPFERARTLLLAGQWSRRFRRKGAARLELAKARDAFERLGAPGWVLKVEDELRRLAPRSQSHDDALTDMELRVARLAATGSTTRDVSAALFLSPRTVEAHLSRVYRKLGIRSRAELGARLGEH